MKLSAYQHGLADKPATATQQTTTRRNIVRLSPGFFSSRPCGLQHARPDQCNEAQSDFFEDESCPVADPREHSRSGEAAYQGAVFDPDRTACGTR